jgi:hypothetical protein
MRSNVVKIAGAFIAGLMIALASALIYVKANSRRDSPPVAQIEQAPEPETAASPEPPSTATAAPQSEPEAPPEESPVARPKPAENRKAARPKAARRTEAPAPVQVVENKPVTAAPSSLPGQSTPAYPTTSQATQDQSTAIPPQTAPAAPVIAPQPHVVELAAGTELAIRLGETLSSDHNYAGDTFRGTLDQRIVRNGFIIAEKGSTVLGRIVEIDKPGRVRGTSQLNVTLTEINTTDGQRIQVQTNSVEKRGQASTGTDTAKIAGGAALGALIGALGGGGKGAAIGAGAGGAAGTGVVLATRGKAAVLPSESRLTFQLASPVTITEKLNQ